ncbi:hypothetical protein [Klebsiella pneumoniae]|uniref:hypothetical protein n=1 Tax=Klebsiella pneumoniae TaxID=573 RepID=UPI000CE19974|nr:hypothetical protein [Klebsiella pneumoniae]POJ92727.1 hypothetical protein C1670_25010 [Klebsiella pneumoniae]
MALAIPTTNYCENVTLNGILLLCILGSLYIFHITGIPGTALLELLIVISTIVLIFTQKVTLVSLLIAMLSISYISYSLFYVGFKTHTNILDFIQAYKSFYYLILMSFFYKRNIFSRRAIEVLFKWLVLLFFIKYSMDKFVVGITRPTVLIENYFELIMLIMLYYFINIIKKEPVMINTGMMMLICVISGSRSSLLALMIAILFSLDRTINFKKLIYILLIPIAGLAVFAIFQERLSHDGYTSYEQIDRFRFLLEFLSSTSNWPWWRFVIGAEPLTPLTPLSCYNLSSYVDLFSYSGDGTCYSVILHSFLLRVIYDHGLLGFMFLMGVVTIYLNKFSLKAKICILLIIISTALSVSSLNNVYVALAIIMYIGIDEKYIEMKK